MVQLSVGCNLGCSNLFMILGGALSFAGNNDSTQKLIQETWAEILARESGLPREVFSVLSVDDNNR